MREDQTDAERKLWSFLRNRQLCEFKFRRQVPIGKYVVDFICHEKNLIIEVDGGQHFENKKDVERTCWLEKRGYRVIRFWNNDVLQNSDGVLQVILKELETQ